MNSVIDHQEENGTYANGEIIPYKVIIEGLEFWIQHEWEMYRLKSFLEPTYGLNWRKKRV